MNIELNFQVLHKHEKVFTEMINMNEIEGVIFTDERSYIIMNYEEVGKDKNDFSWQDVRSWSLPTSYELQSSVNGF